MFPLSRRFHPKFSDFVLFLLSYTWIMTDLNKGYDLYVMMLNCDLVSMDFDLNMIVHNINVSLRSNATCALHDSVHYRP